MKPMVDEFFDYSTILMRIERLQKEMHDACLHKRYKEVPSKANELMEQALLLKQWVRGQK